MRGVLQVLIFVLALGEVARGVVVEMRREAEVDSNIVRLGDVVRFYDVPPGEERRLEAVYVTLAPEPGKVKTVTLGQVKRRLRAAGANLAGMIFEGPTGAEVRRRPAGAGTARATAPDDLTRLVARYVADQLGRDAEQVKVTLAPADARRLQRLARRGLRTAVTRSGAPVRLGSNALEVLAYEGSQLRERITVLVEVRVRCPVPVAARNVPRGRRLSAGDIALEKRLVGDEALAALKPEDLVGKAAARSLRRGQVLRPDLVADLPLVRRGDVVDLVARAGPLQVKTLAKALEDGARGQTIRVRNLNNRKEIAARVTGVRAVLVELR